ncbi:MAG: recA-like protein [Sphingomonas bacterium]|nr:recA-like protein [Sphingomonas bacterium]
MAAGLSLVADGGIRAGCDRERISSDEGNRLPAPATATLSEVFASSARDGGATGFVLAQVVRGKPLLWVQERMAMLEAGRIYPPGLGVDELIHVSARDARTALWAMEEGLRCAALGGVIGEIWGDPKALDFTATRRLAVAAERYGVAAFLIRLGGHANLSGARMRWRIKSAPSLIHPLDPKAPGDAVWDADLFRARGFAPGRWTVSRDAHGQARVNDEDAADRLNLVAAAADRTVAQGERRVG